MAWTALQCQQGICTLLFNLVICSVTFVVYVIALDIVAIINRNTEVSSDIFFKPNQNESKYGNIILAFELEYSIPSLMLAYDFVIFLTMVVGLICKRCGLKKKWYHIGIAPASCIVVHSYHILVGFIQAPHHAASILIFYAVTVFIFYVTFKAAYYNLFQMFQRLTSNEESWKTCVKICNNCLCICPCICFVLLFWPCIILLPFCQSLFSLWTDDACRKCWNWSCCTCTHNNLQPAGRFASCLAWVFCIGCKCGSSNRCCCRLFSCCRYENNYCEKYRLPHPIVLLIISFMSVFLSLVMVFVVVLFILVPINMAIDDAPARLFSINQTGLVFIGAAITYKLYRNRTGASSIIEQIVKANKEYLAMDGNGTEDERTEWNKSEKADKESKIAILMITALHKIGD